MIRSQPEEKIARLESRSIGHAVATNDFDMTIYDAAYVALARTLDTTAYTADETLLEDLDGDDSEE